MSSVTCGRFLYTDLLNEQQILSLPSSLRLSQLNEEALLIRLLTGNIAVNRISEPQRVFVSRKNYMTLPTTRYAFDPTVALHAGLSFDITDPAVVVSIDQYFVKSHNNHELFGYLLNELTQYFLKENKSPTAAFIHLYRSVEFVSYCMPMVYSILTKDFKKSYNSIKSFLLDKDAGQLSFFKTFLVTILRGNAFIHSFAFEYVFQGNERANIEIEFTRLLQEARIAVDIDQGVAKLHFLDVLTFFVAVRNRYFHFSIGSEQENITAFNFNIEDFIRPLNSILINWLSVILSLIISKSYLHL